jgi:nicotinate-nucleotide--dimethylbenzimidazole phosphoribosyltransferase
MTTALPFDDFRRLLETLPAGDRAAFAHPDGVDSLVRWITAWGNGRAALLRPLVAVFAGTHGVAKHAVSSRPAEATAAFVAATAAGDAAVNRICAHHNLGLKVFDLALDLPTGDISTAAAFDERGCAATMAFGMEAIAGGADLLCLAGIGVAGSTVATAMLAALHGGRGADWVRGEGSGADLASRRIERIDAALDLHRGNLKDPFEILRRLGGREIAAIAGAILAARIERIPVLLAGPAALAAAAVLHASNGSALEHCRLASLLAEPAHSRAASRLGLSPLLNLDCAPPEGLGLAAGLVRAALARSPPS